MNLELPLVFSHWVDSIGSAVVLLLAVWIYVLDSKIKHGPDEDISPPTDEGGFLDAAAARVQRTKSLTEAHGDVQNGGVT